jgi:hypothetical protein
MSEQDKEFWRGYLYALDDAERAHNAGLITRKRLGENTWFDRVREKFGLAAFEAKGHDDMVAKMQDEGIAQTSLEELGKNGISDEDAREILQFASRTGRAMPRIDPFDYEWPGNKEVTARIEELLKKQNR